MFPETDTNPTSTKLGSNFLSLFVKCLHSGRRCGCQTTITTRSLMPAATGRISCLNLLPSLSQRTSSRCNEAYEQFLKQLKQNAAHAKDFRLKPFYERVFLKLTRHSPTATTTTTTQTKAFTIIAPQCWGKVKQM